MNSRRWQPASAVAVLALLCACAGSEQSPSTAEPAAQTAPSTASPPSTSSPSDDDPEPDTVDDMAPTSGPEWSTPGLPTGGVTDEIRSRQAVRAAVQDLADRRSVDLGDVEVVGYARVTWSDGARGCPQPGMLYSQALVEGQQLILGVRGDDQIQDSYHAGRSGGFRFCEDPQPPIPGDEGST